jgi:serine phosphatase RsbU (regulator of sigma subunit)
VWGGNRPIHAPIDMPGIQGTVYSQPCGGGKGGDIHYVAICNSGLLARFCLADVVGHGEAVSAVSSEIHQHLRRHIDRPDQRRVLAKLNKQLRRMGFHALTTAAVATYYPPWRRLSISYAGHPPAWLYRKTEQRWTRIPPDEGGRQSRLEVNLPLAVDDRTIYTRRAVKVEHGDRLLLITDGVLETPDANAKLLGVSGLQRVLAEQVGGSVQQVIDAVLKTLTDWAGNNKLSHDDVTMMIVEFVPGPPGPSLWHVVKNRLLRPHGNSDDPIFADPRSASAAD